MTQKIFDRQLSVALINSILLIFAITMKILSNEMKQGNVNKTCYICHKNVQNINYVKSVCIRSYSGPHFPVFGLNTGPNAGKYWPEQLRIRTLLTQFTSYHAQYFVLSVTSLHKTWASRIQELNNLIIFKIHKWWDECS